MFVPLLVVIYFVAKQDLDARVSLPGPHGIPWLIGASIFVFGWAIVTWAMIVNPFFEKTVRIQTDHSHRVIDQGPYAHVRHPGYVGFAAILLATPLLLDSAWTFVPSLLFVTCLVIRTFLEDRLLNRELSGYSDYAQRVRYRLIPAVW
jgi:protein-S-isoprenylcysteine O-methyltransferase Ste14